MKKNILAIVILAATVANIALTSILLFTIVPQLNNVDTFINKICAIIDLELESPNADSYGEIPATQKSNIKFADNVTINLRKTAVDPENPNQKVENHYAIVTVNITLNNGATDYQTVNDLILSNEEVIKGFIIDEIGQYTIEDIVLIDVKNNIKSKVLTKMQNYFQTDTIIDITLNILSQ